jgi:hypothetical protein
MDIDVSTKMARRQGATKENIPCGSSTEEQRSRRGIFGETLRAEILLDFDSVACQVQIYSNMLATHSKIYLSSNVQSFLTGC